jgi:hypothetical protein
VNCDCDDILISFDRPRFACGPMNETNQGLCHSRKIAKYPTIRASPADFPNQLLV